MNVASDSQQLTRGASENNLNATGLNTLKKSTKQQKSKSTGATTRSGKKTDSVQISKAGAALARASSAGIQQEAVHGEKSDQRSQTATQQMSSQNYGIESLMAKYKEAQNFMAQIESKSFDRTV